MRRNQLLSIALICGLSCALAACGTGTGEPTYATDAVRFDSYVLPAPGGTDPSSENPAVETLKKGEQRGYGLHDIFQNELEIDGKSIQFPCTVDELMGALGEDYSVRDVSPARSLLYKGKETGICVANYTEDTNYLDVLVYQYVGEATGNLTIRRMRKAHPYALADFTRTFPLPDSAADFAGKQLRLDYYDGNDYLYAMFADGRLTELGMSSYVLKSSVQNPAYATLPEGEKRAYTLENVLKNKLEYDGKPVFIPCTAKEFLHAMGKDYGFSPPLIQEKLEKPLLVASDYVSGGFAEITLYQSSGDGIVARGEVNIVGEPGIKDTEVDYKNIHVVGLNYSERVSLFGISAGDDVNLLLEKYGLPDSCTGDKSITLGYYEDPYRLTVTVKEGVILNIDARYYVQYVGE